MAWRDTQNVLEEVRTEREKQDKQWGGPDHDDQHGLEGWYALLEERVKKIERESGLNLKQSQPVAPRRLRHEALVLAALAVAYVEALDRLAWDKNPRFEERKEGSRRMLVER